MIAWTSEKRAWETASGAQSARCCSCWQFQSACLLPQRFCTISFRGSAVQSAECANNRQGGREWHEKHQRRDRRAGWGYLLQRSWQWTRSPSGRRMAADGSRVLNMDWMSGRAVAGKRLARLAGRLEKATIAGPEQSAVMGLSGMIFRAHLEPS